VSEIEWQFFLDVLTEDDEKRMVEEGGSPELYALTTGHDIDKPPRYTGYDERNFDYTEKRWRDVQEAVLAAWIEQHPGSRPTAWWKWEAHEPRGPRETQAAYLDRLGLWAPGEKKARAANLREWAKQMKNWTPAQGPMPTMQ
jgi:hypothetical protein